jgi:nucleoside phosphorylase
MVGIAFGRDAKKQQLGDVLVSSIVHCYELQRVGSDITIQRGPSPECGEMLLEAVHNVQGWSYLLAGGKESQIRIGPILSGEKLVDRADYKKRLFDAYPDGIGGEMEAAGVYAAASTEGTGWIMVKGICDWADGTKCDGYQKVAASAAVSLVKKVLCGPL